MIKQRKIFNNFYHFLTFIGAFTIVLVIVGIFFTLIKESLPAIRQFGLFGFITTAEWDPMNDIYGGLRPLFGTLLSTIIALIFAIPISLGIAIFITELCPHKLRGVIGTAIELLATIPSIIYGMWGLFVFAPLVEKTLQKVISSALAPIPLIGVFFKTTYPGGVNLFTASLVLAIMITPFIASIARDSFNLVPPMLKESAYGIGSTRWEALRDVVIPFSKSGIFGGVVIATGRALGETMAVAYVIGNRHGSLSSIFDPYTTITSVLANEFNEAAGVHMSSLFLLALVLFVSNLFILAAAKIYINKKREI